MNRKINNLEELLREKALLKAQIKIVQTEMAASAQRTRQEFKLLVDDKLSLSKQLGQMFQGGVQQFTENSALGVIGKVASGGSWWGGMIAGLLPMVVDFVKKQIQRRKEKKLTAAVAAPVAETAPKPKSRKLFRRKKTDTE